MKFCLVFVLGFFVFSAQALSTPEVEQSGNANHGLQNIIDAIIKFAQKVVNGIRDAVNTTVEKLQDTLNNILDNITKTINAITQQIDETLAKLAQLSEKARECVEKYRTQIQAVKEKAQNETELCHNEAKQSAGALKDNIQQHVEVIQGLIGEAKNIVKDCVENESGVVTVIGCVMEKSNEIRNKIKLALIEAGKAVGDIAKQSVAISNNFRQCTRVIRENLQKENAELVKKIQTCIAE